MKTLRNQLSLLVGVLVSALLFPLAALAESGGLIPYEEFTLDNGLRLIVHEDHKAPVVAVNIWYHVGSRNEKPGQTGYAHLFEHLMFQGSENVQEEYLTLLPSMGATDLNGTTWMDRTNYFQTVPVGALDKTLFIESDRMGHLLEVLDQDVLDEQRGVVQNEKRQGDNQPYSSIWVNTLENLFPSAHPYSWSTIGSMEDLEAASLEQMHEWFRTYYGPNNAVLVVAGDVDPQQVRDRVEHYFGDIPPGPPLTTRSEWIPRHKQERRITVQDRVPQERIYMAWTAPRWGTEEAAHLSLALDVLASGKNSRLYQRLVYEEQTVSDLDLTALFFEIAGVVILEFSIKNGEDSAEVERIAREELAKLIAKGPTRTELERVQTAERAGFLRGLEKVGGRGGKSSVLAEHAVYGGDPGHYSKWQSALADATRGQLRDALDNWLGQQAAFVANYVPYPQLNTATEGADRSEMPEQLEPEPAAFPEFSRSTLANGLELVVVERPGLPILNLNLIVRAGYANDPAGKAGEASMAMAMLDEGTDSMDALEISERLALQGAQLSTRARLDYSTVSLSALIENLDESLDIFSEVALRPSFPEDELERVRSQYQTRIQQEKSRPLTVAIRLMPGLLYGDGHPYAQPLTGSGHEDTIAALSRTDLASWHDSWFRPNNASLVVVGDTTLEQIQPKIEKLFRNWREGELPTRSVPPIPASDSPRFYLVDKPEAEQSIILVGQLFPPMDNPDEIAIEAMNDILGGQSSARINTNLREDKGWSYGAFSLILSTGAQRPWLAYAPVQSDKTGPAVAEMMSEITQFLGEAPAQAEELEQVQRSNILSLPGRWETGPAVLRDLNKIVSFGLSDDYWDRYATDMGAISLEQVNAAAGQYLSTGQLVWVVIGDRSVVEAELRELGIAEIQMLDADGNSQ